MLSPGPVKELVHKYRVLNVKIFIIVLAIPEKASPTFLMPAPFDFDLVSIIYVNYF